MKKLLSSLSVLFASAALFAAGILSQSRCEPNPAAPTSITVIIDHTLASVLLFLRAHGTKKNRTPARRRSRQDQRFLPAHGMKKNRTPARRKSHQVRRFLRARGMKKNRTPAKPNCLTCSH